MVLQCVSQISALERAAFLQHNPDDAEIVLVECWTLLLSRAMVTAASGLVVQAAMAADETATVVAQRRSKGEWNMLHATLVFRYRTMTAAQLKTEKDKLMAALASLPSEAERLRLLPSVGGRPTKVEYVRACAALELQRRQAEEKKAFDEVEKDLTQCACAPYCVRPAARDSSGGILPRLRTSEVLL